MKNLQEKLSTVLEQESIDQILYDLGEIATELFQQPGFKTSELKLVSSYHKTHMYLRKKLHFADEVTYKNLDAMYIARAIANAYRYAQIELKNSEELESFAEKLNFSYNLGISLKKLALKISDIKRKRLKFFNKKALVANAILLIVNLAAILFVLI